jgi:hypothetical protein
MMKKKTTYSLKITPAQFALKKGDQVEYARDNGKKSTHAVSREPFKLGGYTWVVYLEGVKGGVALSRCQPISELSKSANSGTGGNAD